MDPKQSDLVGKLLIAMPGMSDPRFAHSVIFMCAHSAEGGMGLILNKPQKELTFGKLLDQLEIPRKADLDATPVHIGGPVERQRGFVLHSNDYKAAEGTITVDDTYCMTATLQILEDIAQGQGPSRAMLALGYAGWGPSQLEYEIGRNGWLTAAPDETIVFGRTKADKWSEALKSMGIDPLLLSATAGRA